MSCREFNPENFERSQALHTRPANAAGLYTWIEHMTGIRVARTAVCHGHHAPWDFLKATYFDRPKVCLALGGRGTGKSFLSALSTHLTNRWNPNHRVRVLGGSLAQSYQIYEAMQKVVREMELRVGQNHHEFEALLRDRGIYPNGSEVAILAASSTSVRGPHVPTLLLDEVDEIATDLRESAMGMCMNLRGMSASTIMTSTWHKAGGPMTELVERGNKGEFPFFKFCLFEVLEKCPESRSGEYLENCDMCPLKKWCHDVPKGQSPKAKRARGHYSIDSVIQKLMTVSTRVFEADYLCSGPRPDGVWFKDFNEHVHVTNKAEYQPGSPYFLALDSGVYTGAVLFQIHMKPVEIPGATLQRPSRTVLVPEVHVFAEYLNVNEGLEHTVVALSELMHQKCKRPADRQWTDPAGNSSTSFGMSVITAYEKKGLKMEPWPRSGVLESLAQVDSLLNPAQGPPRLFIHPECRKLIQAMKSYRRKRLRGEWEDKPEDPQHPHEDLIDALRGGLMAEMPKHLSVVSQLDRVSINKVF